jgi:small multidrug resistance pump
MDSRLSVGFGLFRSADPMARHRGWLLAAAGYNLAWGSITVLAPNLFFDVVGVARPNYSGIWQVVGLFVLLYAPAYAAAAMAPSAARLLVAIALAGKLAGPAGFVVGFAAGSLPWQFVFVILTNDLIWWPFFAAYFRESHRLSGSWWRAFVNVPGN